jgi:hypothetical protein
MPSFLPTDLDGLKSALISGTLTVRDAAGRFITYRSVAEIQAAIQAVEGALGTTGGGQPMIRRIRTYSRNDKGL